MGALAQGLQSAGQAASDFGQARINFSDWQQQQRQQRLAEIIQGVRLQQIQQELRQAQLPQSEGIIQGQGGAEYGVNRDPLSGKRSLEKLLPGIDMGAVGAQSNAAISQLPEEIRPIAKGIYDMYAAAGDPSSGLKALATMAEHSAKGTEDPLKDIQAEGIRAEIRGDTAKANRLRGIYQEWTGAKRATPRPNEIELITRSLAGDPDAKAVLADLRKSRLDLVRERGTSFGLGRLGTYLDRDTGAQETMLGFDALAALRSGRNIVMQSPLSPDRILSAQRLFRESGPAIKTVKDNIKAFDNVSDQAIFSKAFRENPFSGNGEPESWYDSVINKVMSANLSPEGRRLATSLKVLNETLGTLRGSLGLPATNSATAMTLGIAPGLDSTPDSNMARLQLDSLTQVVERSLAVPILGGGAALGNPQSPRSPATSVVPPPGAKIRDYTQVGP